MHLARLLEAAALSFPDRPAVSLADRLLHTYRDYGALAARLAGGLATAGVRPGERVLLAMSNNADYLAALFAVWRAGAVAAPANAKLHPRELAFMAADGGARLGLATPDLADGLAL